MTTVLTKKELEILKRAQSASKSSNRWIIAYPLPREELDALVRRGLLIRLGTVHRSQYRISMFGEAVVEESK